MTNVLNLSKEVQLNGVFIMSSCFIPTTMLLGHLTEKATYGSHLPKDILTNGAIRV